MFLEYLKFRIFRVSCLCVIMSFYQDRCVASPVWTALFSSKRKQSRRTFKATKVFFFLLFNDDRTKEFVFKTCASFTQNSIQNAFTQMCRRGFRLQSCRLRDVVGQNKWQITFYYVSRSLRGKAKRKKYQIRAGTKDISEGLKYIFALNNRVKLRRRINNFPREKIIIFNFL